MTLHSTYRDCCSTEFVADSSERAVALHVDYHNTQHALGRRSHRLTADEQPEQPEPPCSSWAPFGMRKSFERLDASLDGLSEQERTSVYAFLVGWLAACVDSDQLDEGIEVALRHTTGRNIR